MIDIFTYAKVQHQLIKHIGKVANMAIGDEEEILDFFRHVNFEKKHNLQEAGASGSSLFFVLKGCLRMYFLSEKGGQYTTQFAIENWWIADLNAFYGKKTTDFYIQAVEHSDVLAIDLASYDRLTERFPHLEKYFRIIYQRGFAASQVRMKYNHDLSREELYHRFANNYPEFLQRVPQYMLASFLGFTPEYLSELRKKRS